MRLEEKNKIHDILLKNCDYLGITFNPKIMSHERIKELPIDIMDNIDLANRNI